MKEQEEIEKLRKKAQDDKLSAEERKEAKEQLDRMQDKALSREQKEQLEQQLKDLKEDLQRLSRNKDEEAQRLREQAARGELDREQLQRELDQLEKNAAKMDQETLDRLKEMADQLGECEQCMKEGKDGEAGRKLKELAAKLGKLDGDAEVEELRRQLDELQAARRMICRALDKGGNQAAQAAGRRPESKEGETAAKEERARSRLDKGRLQVIDHVPGDGFKGPRRPAEMREEIRKASQEAPEAIDRQRLPRSASDMARGYFEKLRGPDAGKPAPKP
jgi:DNA repair exonuclease SbcCD ATPase subunit